jgi:2-methylisocitrate lyase-like PEP mutase family enzyme
VLYAPGPRERADIKAIIDAVAPKPVNVLMGWHTGLTLADLAALGARRVSVEARSPAPRGTGSSRRLASWRRPAASTASRAP